MKTKLLKKLRKDFIKEMRFYHTDFNNGYFGIYYGGVLIATPAYDIHCICEEKVLDEVLRYLILCYVRQIKKKKL